MEDRLCVRWWRLRYDFNAFKIDRLRTHLFAFIRPLLEERHEYSILYALLYGRTISNTLSAVNEARKIATSNVCRAHTHRNNKFSYHKKPTHTHTHAMHKHIHIISNEMAIIAAIHILWIWVIFDSKHRPINALFEFCHWDATKSVALEKNVGRRQNGKALFFSNAAD